MKAGSGHLLHSQPLDGLMNILYNLEMTEISIQLLTQIETTQLRALITGYTSTEKYNVTKIETENRTTINLEIQTLDQPYIKKWVHDAEMEDHYLSILNQGLSFGLYNRDDWVGVAIGEKRAWNRSLWVWEFLIHPDYQGKGWGRKLMDTLAKAALQAGCRVMVCETQNTNIPAIRFYRKLGFEIGGVDLSYYTNQDLTNFEVAIFMKRYLQT
jgi:GNAT superfamily N-acetyltransferase